jgi:antitoxin component of MazEF toxin-antitoxin module
MSENLPTLKAETDLSEKDLEKVHQFKGEGLPGLAKLNETDFYRMTEMYMNGLTYWQISTTLNISRPLVMYLSHTYQWYPAKQEYLSELQEKIKGRVIDSKLASQDFILLLIQAYQKRIGGKLKQYLATDDGERADEINLKEIDKVLKAIEILQNLSGDGKSSAGKTPAVGLNLGDGVTIERSGDNKVTITPAIDKHLSGMLKKMADERRAEQNKSDIKENEPKNEE